MARERTAYIGLGANLGEPVDTLVAATEALRAAPGLRLTGLSSLYRSAPVDAAGPDFVNAVARLQCTLPPLAVLDQLQAIERSAGRQRPFRNAPRTLDLDLLHLDGLRLDHARLQVPHPRLYGRLFVLLPLLELWPDAEWPEWGRGQDQVDRLPDQRIERMHPVPRWQALQAAVG